MLILLVAIACLRSLGSSAPIPHGEPLQSGPLPVQNYRMRTRFDIAWSCASTIFICTWVAIHPNVPPREKSRIRSLGRSFWIRIKLMLCTLVVPELVLIWAFRQWAAARYIAMLFQDAGWTAAHGHLLIMGGFTLCHQGETVLDYESLCELFNIQTPCSSEDHWLFRRLRGLQLPHELSPYLQYLPFRRYLPLIGPHQRRFSEPFEIAFPTITEAEIFDKSKTDFLSKAIAIVQTLWFIVQCVARLKQGLALTELELVTLAIASLNGVMYYFWWDKPLGVNEPIKIYPNDPPKTNIRAEDVLSRFNESRSSSANQLFRNLLSFFRDPLPSILRSPALVGRLLSSMPRLLSSMPGLSSVPLLSSILRLLSSIPRLLSSIPHLLSSIPHLLSSIPHLLSSIPHLLSSVVLSPIKTHLVDERKSLEKLRLPCVQYLWPFYLPIKWFLRLIRLVPILIRLVPILISFLFSPATLFIIFLLILCTFLFDGFLAIAYTPLILPNAPHVPTFYAPHTNSAVLLPLLTIVLPFISIIFGALHCIAWNFQFPSPVEQWLWRSTSLSITLIPSFHVAYLIFVIVFILPVGYLTIIFSPLSIPEIVKTILKAIGIFFLSIPAIAFGILVVVCLLGYVLARFSLLTQAIVLLRQQPESAFYAINWSSFIPHV